jgi:hypothetical protein
MVRLIHREIKETEMLFTILKWYLIVQTVVAVVAVTIAELNGITVFRGAWWMIQTIVYAGAR